MLTILMGPSGVGKTAVSSVLHEKYGWSVVSCLTTRPSRVNEKFKVHTTLEDFQTKMSAGELYSVQRVYGHLYGQYKSEVVSAIETGENWVIDLHPEMATDYKHLPHILIVLIPETEVQLREQLNAVGRQARISTSISEHREIYLPIVRCGKFGDRKVGVVVSRPSSLHQTAELVKTTVLDARAAQ